MAYKTKTLSEEQLDDAHRALQNLIFHVGRLENPAVVENFFVMCFEDTSDRIGVRFTWHLRDRNGESAICFALSPEDTLTVCDALKKAVSDLKTTLN